MISRRVFLKVATVTLAADPACAAEQPELTSSGGMAHLTPVSPGATVRPSDVNQYYALFHGGQVHDVVATYGARGDGSADDAPAIQSAMDAAAASGGGTIILQTGTYSIGRTLTLIAASNVRIQGLASTGESDRTILRWDGPRDGTVLFVDRVRDSVFEGFSIVNGATAFGVGIDADQTADNLVTTNLTFRELDITGGTIAGIRLANSDRGNNDLHKFDNVQFFGEGPAGLRMNNGNSKGHILWGGTFAHKQTGIDQIRGSFHCYGTNFETNGCDISLRNTTDTITINGIQSENSGCFLRAAGSSWPFAVLVVGSRIAPSRPNPDGRFLIFRHAGPLTLLNNDFATGAYIPGPFFQIEGQGEPSIFHAIGNVFPNDRIFSGARFTVGHIVGNRYWHDHGHTELDDYHGPFAGAPRQNFKMGQHLLLDADLVHSSQAPAFTASFTPDPTQGEHTTMTLIADIAVNAPANAVRGQELTFIWTQDGSGGRRIGYDPVYRTGGVAPLVSTANTVTIDRFYCVDGRTWRLVSRVTGQ